MWVIHCRYILNVYFFYIIRLQLLLFKLFVSIDIVISQFFFGIILLSFVVFNEEANHCDIGLLTSLNQGLGTSVWK